MELSIKNRMHQFAPCNIIFSIYAAISPRQISSTYVRTIIFSIYAVISFNIVHQDYIKHRNELNCI